MGGMSQFFEGASLVIPNPTTPQESMYVAPVLCRAAGG
jgi:hypothetical protein